MYAYTPDFKIDVKGIQGLCPAGEAYAREQMHKGTMPILSCEGPCIRGEIARLAASIVAEEVPGAARACHAEAFFVPHSAMAQWVRSAEKSLMIDGCFLRCHGRVLAGLVGTDSVIEFDALSCYRKYTGIFAMNLVPEEDRKAAARQVADRIISELARAGRLAAEA